MTKKWSNISELSDKTIVNRLSSEYDISIPGNFSEFIRLYNGGSVFPRPYVYSQKESRGVMMDRILTFNENDTRTSSVNALNVIIDLVCSDKELLGIPFAMSDRGILSVSGNSVLHRDNVTGETWVLDDSFSHFMAVVV